MTVTLTQTLQFAARIEDGVLVPEDDTQLEVFLEAEKVYIVSVEVVKEVKSDAKAENPAEAPDALAEILAEASALGPPDLARNFDSYTGRVFSDGAH